MSIHLCVSAAEFKVILDRDSSTVSVFKFRIARQGVLALNLFQNCTPFASFTQFNIRMCILF
ncbi:hypothetical protein NP493_1164g00000 [Ridgeia piscesae]|uniref:Uncharacterized protein n=1 Tax=Ridgeia piscesae TaxID=27915 RepID=A0AAD9NH39_RIDPI|nr:hypothetical protein NP493_1164g00000 [Ridgeia piscesae]